METLLDKVPYSGVIVAIVVVVMGIAASLYMLDGYRDRKKKNQDATDDRVISLLQLNVKELEKTVSKQTVDIEGLSKKVTALERENETLIKVLQGRDAQTQEFYKQGFEAMKKTDEIRNSLDVLVKAVKTLSSGLKTNNDMTTDFVKTIKEHFLIVEKAAISK